MNPSCCIMIVKNMLGCKYGRSMPVKGASYFPSDHSLLCPFVKMEFSQLILVALSLRCCGMHAQYYVEGIEREL